MLNKEYRTWIVTKNSVHLQDVTIIGHNLVIFKVKTLSLCDLFNGSTHVWVVFSQFDQVCFFLLFIVIGKLFHQVIIIFFNQVLSAGDFGSKLIDEFEI